MSSTDPIVAAARRLARILLKTTPHCPDIEFIGVRRTKTGCDTIATESGFDVRIDRLRSGGEITPEVLVSRVYHAAAHMLCIQAGVPSHSGSGRHTNGFALALEELGAPDEVKLSDLTKSQQVAAIDFAKALKLHRRTLAPTARTAYDRATVVCPAEGCRHTLTLRKSAIAKTRFLCVEHGEEMTTTNV